MKRTVEGIKIEAIEEIKEGGGQNGKKEDSRYFWR